MAEKGIKNFRHNNVFGGQYTELGVGREYGQGICLYQLEKATVCEEDVTKDFHVMWWSVTEFY